MLQDDNKFMVDTINKNMAMGNYNLLGGGTARSITLQNDNVAYQNGYSNGYQNGGYNTYQNGQGNTYQNVPFQNNNSNSLITIIMMLLKILMKVLGFGGVENSQTYNNGYSNNGYISYNPLTNTNSNIQPLQNNNSLDYANRLMSALNGGYNNNLNLQGNTNNQNINPNVPNGQNMPSYNTLLVQNQIMAEKLQKIKGILNDNIVYSNYSDKQFANQMAYNTNRNMSLGNNNIFSMIGNLMPMLGAMFGASQGVNQGLNQSQNQAVSYIK